MKFLIGYQLLLPLRPHTLTFNPDLRFNRKTPGAIVREGLHLAPSCGWYWAVDALQDPGARCICRLGVLLSAGPGVTVGGQAGPTIRNTQSSANARVGGRLIAEVDGISSAGPGGPDMSCRMPTARRGTVVEPAPLSAIREASTRTSGFRPCSRRRLFRALTRGEQWIFRIRGSHAPHRSVIPERAPHA